MTELAEYETQLAASRRDLEVAEATARAANATLESVRRRTNALEQIVEGLRTLDADEQEPQRERLPISESVVTEGHTTVTVDEGQPRGREAVRLVMRDSGRAWKQADLIAEIKRRGWVDPNAKQPDAAIRVAVRRLADDGEIQKVPGAQGVYRYKDSGGTPSGEATRAASGSERSMTIEEV